MTIQDAIDYAEDKGTEDGAEGRPYSPPFNGSCPEAVEQYCRSYWFALILVGGPLANLIDPTEL